MFRSKAVLVNQGREMSQGIYKQGNNYGSAAPPYGPPAGGYGPPAGGYGPPAGGYGPPAGAYNPPAGAYQPQYQQPSTVVYVEGQNPRDRDTELAEDCCLIACCWTLLCCCLVNN